jgi:hypothetical protein
MRQRMLFAVALASAVSSQNYPGVKEVRYEITGTIHVANATRKNKDGGSEQIQVDVPYVDKFYAQVGASLYLSVQKARVTKPDGGLISQRFKVVDDGVEGTVHVLIRVAGKVLQEAEASAPYGIATASGVVPE